MIFVNFNKNNYFCVINLFFENIIMENNSDNHNNIVRSLNERNKELECIYKLDEILKDFESEIKTVLQQLVNTIPDGFRFEEICKVKISIDETSVETDGFKRTELKLHSNILVNENKVGEIILCYVKPVRAEKGVFLSEENRLFSTIAERLNQYVAFRKLKETYTESHEPKVKSPNSDEKFTKWLISMHLSPKEIAILTKVPIDFRKAENICKQGSFSSFVMILKEGLVKASIENTNYRSHVFKITKPFSIIGLSNLYGDNYYHFSAKAIIPSKVFLVERSVFDNIVKNNQKFALEIMRMYCDSLQNIYDKLGSIVNKQALGKVCDALLYLSVKIFESNFIENSISRKDMAEFAGMSTENFVRILSELKKDEIITIHSKSIEINNFERLRMLSNLG